LGTIHEDVTSKVDSGAGDNLSKEGKLGDTSVLNLNVTKTVETILVGIVQKSKRIEESKRRLGTKLTCYYNDDYMMFKI